MVEVEQWAELRREHFVRGVSIKELARRTGLSRNTIRSALRSEQPPRYSRAAAGSKLDPFRTEIGRLLHKDPDLPGVRVGELLEPLGWDGGKTILDDYLREIRPLFPEARTTQRTIYRPAEICQFDVWEPKGAVPVGVARDQVEAARARADQALVPHRRNGTRGRTAPATPGHAACAARGGVPGMRAAPHASVTG